MGWGGISLLTGHAFDNVTMSMHGTESLHCPLQSYHKQITVYSIVERNEKHGV
jgi:hypothetical protein